MKSKSLEMVPRIRVLSFCWLSFLCCCYSSWAQDPAADVSSTSSSCRPNSLRIPAEAGKYRRSPTDNVLVIAHRGASYHLPEHTAEAYRLALELGADFIEPDLVVTQDGTLIALHTNDLNITTNVVEVFGNSIEPWYSNTVGRAGYWVFNFTWAQIQQLRVRQRLPAARSTAFDGLFRIPSLEQILQTLHQWNTVDLVARMALVDDDSSSNAAVEPGHPSPIQKFRAGLYAELKEREWILKDTGMDLVDLLFDSISNAFAVTNQDVNSNDASMNEYWRELLTCFETIRYDEYIVPGLVLQSFDAHDLQRFHEKWTDPSSGIVEAAEPPYILLANRKTCWTEELWIDIGEEWRSFLSGIGCDKECLFGATESERREAAAFVDKAEQFNLVLHPYTERPEREYVVSGAFASSEEEVSSLMCGKVMGVHGMFTESVDAALRVQCDPDENGHDKKTNPTPGKSDGSCYDNVASSAARGFFIGMISFLIGILGTSIGYRLVSNQRERKKFDSGRATQIPQMEDDDSVVSDDHPSANGRVSSSGPEFT